MGDSTAASLIMSPKAQGHFAKKFPLTAGYFWLITILLAAHIALVALGEKEGWICKILGFGAISVVVLTIITLLWNGLTTAFGWWENRIEMRIDAKYNNTMMRLETSTNAIAQSINAMALSPSIKKSLDKDNTQISVIITNPQIIK